MFVTWLTFSDCIDAIVIYGSHPNALRYLAKGNVSLFIDGGKLHTKRYVSRATLTNLKSGTTYCMFLATKKKV